MDPNTKQFFIVLGAIAFINAFSILLYILDFFPPIINLVLMGCIGAIIGIKVCNF